VEEVMFLVSNFDFYSKCYTRSKHSEGVSKDQEKCKKFDTDHLVVDVLPQ
jgi:hypothetical protein